MYQIGDKVITDDNTAGVIVQLSVRDGMYFYLVWCNDAPRNMQWYAGHELVKGK